MATTLRDFIAHREGEIRDLLKALKAELRELQIAKGALEQGGPGDSPAGAAGPTIKDMAREVLADAETGMTSSEILAAIKDKYGRDIDRTSLSPQLSRLKDGQELELRGERWFTKANHATWEETILRKARERIRLMDDGVLSQNVRAEEEY